MTQKELDLAITKLEVDYCKGKVEYAEKINSLKYELELIEMEYQRKINALQHRMRNVNSNMEVIKRRYLERKASLLNQFNSRNSEA